MIDEILEHNKRFVAQRGGESFRTDKYPKKGIAILSCMDTRLLELLPAVLNIRNGDVKMIKNAGAAITDPFDSVMKSLLVAIYELRVNEVMVIGHTHCGVEGMKGSEMQELMLKRGIPAERLELVKRCGIDLDKWLTGFENTEQAVRDTVALIRTHPLVPDDVRVRGFIVDTDTGELTPLT